MKLNARVSAAIGAAVLVAGGALAVLPSAGATVQAPHTVFDGYAFSTHDNNGDPTFNQLLGINDHHEIVGYFGSGASGHPNQGYRLVPPYGQANFTPENFPGSMQTQVTGLNNGGITVGFFSNQNNANLMNDNEGFYQTGGVAHEINFPTNDPASPPVDQLLGVNGHNVAVGFYTNGQGFNRSYTYNIGAETFARVLEPGHRGASLTATGINLAGFICGFYLNHGVTDGFLKTRSQFIILAVPGASATQAFGLNNRSEVVGSYTVGTGANAVMHGFTWTKRGGFVRVDDPHGKGTTTINGVNNEGDLVGFYTADGGNITKGFLAIPAEPGS